MTNEPEAALLNQIYRNAEMGRDGLYYVLRKTDDPAFRRLVETQLMEYQSIMDDAGDRLRNAGQTPQGSPPAAKLLARLTASRKAAQNNTPSALAEMLIQGSAMGVTKIARQLSLYRSRCEEAAELAARLQKTEENNIHQLKSYL